MEQAGPSQIAPPGPIPTVWETKERLDDFLPSFGKRRASSSFINRTADKKKLENASPQKRQKVIDIIGELSKQRGQSGLNSGQNAAAQLTMRVASWENGAPRE